MSYLFQEHLTDDFQEYIYYCKQTHLYFAKPYRGLNYKINIMNRSSNFLSTVQQKMTLSCTDISGTSNCHFCKSLTLVQIFGKSFSQTAPVG